ncbi:MAG: hypothetical protein UX89_C0002G0047 [Parcubacteria group bacterium GW2011_GWA2_47_16]|nr:MAG: hypothetical protein UX89_C0002G0047 [Parcubacteria group bacterium GW2011_GWA2_47_16]
MIYSVIIYPQPPTKTTTSLQIMQENSCSLLTFRCGDLAITTANGRTPAILVTGDNPTAEVTITVNCLRNNCPSVQLLFIKDSTNSKIAYSEAKELFDKLALPGEKFVCTGESSETESSVWLVTRKFETAKA